MKLNGQHDFPNLRFWTIFDGRRERLPFPPAVFTILSENNRREKLLRYSRGLDLINTQQSQGDLSTLVHLYEKTVGKLLDNFQ